MHRRLFQVPHRAVWLNSISALKYSLPTVHSVEAFVLTKYSLVRTFKSRNMEFQFWGYEVGNILAAIAGAGGFALFFQTTGDVVSDQQLYTGQKLALLVAVYPDVAVVLGIVGVTVLAPLLKKILVSPSDQLRNAAFDTAVLFAAAVVLFYAITAATNWVSIAGATFVVASTLLRHCHSNPFLLKAGGLALVSGGLSLVMFARDEFANQQTNNLFPTMMLLSGLYTAGAGLLTWNGGIYKTKNYRDKLETQGSNRLFNQLFHANHGIVSVLFAKVADGPVIWLCRWLVSPSIFWISAETKAHKPLLTSMWARLPWRLLAGGAALGTATPQGLAFALSNVCWALGDVAVGSEEWELRNRLSAHEHTSRQSYPGLSGGPAVWSMGMCSIAGVMLLLGLNHSDGFRSGIRVKVPANHVDYGSASVHTVMNTAAEPLVKTAIATGVSFDNTFLVSGARNTDFKTEKTEAKFNRQQRFSSYVEEAKAASARGNRVLSKKLLSKAQAILFGTVE